MSRAAPIGPLLLILLLLPTPALCLDCAAGDCERPMAPEDCPMKRASDDCCDDMSKAAHGPHAPAMAADPAPMEHHMPMGHGCDGHSRPDRPAAADADCCAATAGRDETAAPAPVPTSAASPGPQVHLTAPELAPDATEVHQAPPPAPRALFTLHSALLI